MLKHALIPNFDIVMKRGIKSRLVQKIISKTHPARVKAYCILKAIRGPCMVKKILLMMFAETSEIYETSVLVTRLPFTLFI